jgi:hypothetical protein
VVHAEAAMICLVAMRTGDLPTVLCTTLAHLDRFHSNVTDNWLSAMTTFATKNLC